MEPARLNPFRSECVERLAFRFGRDWDWTRLVGTMARLNWRASIVGPHGAGKTTLLEQLAEQMAAQGRVVRCVRFDTGSNRDERWRELRTLRNLEPRAMVFLDGAEQLPSWEWLLWKWQTRRLSGLVITSHSTGRLPCAYRCETSEELLADLVSELDSALAVGLGTVATRETYRACAGNLREALRRLYDQRNHARVLNH